MSTTEDLQAFQLANTVVTPADIKDKVESDHKSEDESESEHKDYTKGLHQRVWQSFSKQQVETLMSWIEPYRTSEEFAVDTRRAENYLIEKFSL
jgi:hypothetical protein